MFFFFARSILVLDELDAVAPSALSLIFGLPGQFPLSFRMVTISNDLAEFSVAHTLYSLAITYARVFAVYRRSNARDNSGSSRIVVQ